MLGTKRVYEKPLLTKRDRLSIVTAASGPSITLPVG
ncbi:putative RiPP precursor [Mesorhizobium sp. NZP2298]|nr:putative RiPP precursor [Mesorhizobium sp. NZP2298]